jgi:predicted glycoside hydrolase/deacetylase ChbG (UPF0249 family)
MKLIVNADDFGYFKSVSDGILRAHHEGIVTATTLLVAAPDSERASRLARSVPDLDVGVHLNVTFDRPLSDPVRVRSLVDEDGKFLRPRTLLSREIDRDEALLEFRAQHLRARQLIAREPTHVDTHHWVHDHPALEWAIGELALKTGAVARIHSDEQRDRLRSRGVRTVDHFMREFQHAGNISVVRLLALLHELSRLTGITELMCHPGEADAGLATRSGYATERATELATLTDPRVRSAIERLGIELAPFTSA